MNRLLSSITLGLALCSGGAWAASHAGAPMAGASAAKPAAAAAAKDAEPTKQQNKMTTCNKEAGGKKGDERKAFMKTCLSDGKTAQQNKMTTCNAEAKDKKGDERKKFMSQCLKG